MAYFVTRKANESSEKAVNRWKKLTQRFTREQKRSGYNQKEPRKWQVREAAIKREGHRSERQRKQFYS